MMTLIFIFVIVCFVVVLFNALWVNRNIRKMNIHNRANEWYRTHNQLTDPKPDYVLESERLRRRMGFR